jgi:hypothetical protein
VGQNDDLFYIRNDFEKFKERYSSRIDNFRHYLREYDNIKFVIRPEENGFNPTFLKTLMKKNYNKDVDIITL